MAELLLERSQFPNASTSRLQVRLQVRVIIHPPRHKFVSHSAMQKLHRHKQARLDLESCIETQLRATMTPQQGPIREDGQIQKRQHMHVQLGQGEQSRWREEAVCPCLAVVILRHRAAVGPREFNPNKLLTPDFGSVCVRPSARTLFIARLICHLLLSLHRLHELQRLCSLSFYSHSICFLLSCFQSADYTHGVNERGRMPNCFCE